MHQLESSLSALTHGRNMAPRDFRDLFSVVKRYDGKYHNKEDIESRGNQVFELEDGSTKPWQFSKDCHESLQMSKSINIVMGADRTKKNKKIPK